MAAYAKDFPEEFHWATGATAPALLHQLLSAIEAGCGLSIRQPARLVDRGPATAASVGPAHTLRFERGARAETSLAPPSHIRGVYGLPEIW
jgi:hypothetical protein